MHREAVAAGLGLALTLYKTTVFKRGCGSCPSHLAQVGLPDNYASLPAGKAPIPQIIEHMKKDKKIVQQINPYSGK